MKPSTKANLFFLLITAIWGATFPLIKLAVKELNPNLFVCLRFGLAALVLLPLASRQFKKIDLPLLKAGLILGVLNGACYGLQTVGLQSISASRSAFITGAGVVFVPIFSYFFKLSSFVWLDFMAALICLMGLYILTGANLTGLSLGDLVTLLAAIAWALTIVFMQRLSIAQYSVLLLSFFQIAFTIPLPLIFAFPALLNLQTITMTALWVIVFCAVLATILPMFFQTRYQRDTTAAQTALIFSLEPVFASLYAGLFFHEVMNKNLVMGGVFILLSIVLPILPSFLRANA